MRYELADYEWSAIKPVLPNSARTAGPASRNVHVPGRGHVSHDPGRLPSPGRITRRFVDLASSLLTLSLVPLTVGIVIDAYLPCLAGPGRRRHPAGAQGTT